MILFSTSVLETVLPNLAFGRTLSWDKDMGISDSMYSFLPFSYSQSWGSGDLILTAQELFQDPCSCKVLDWISDTLLRNLLGWELTDSISILDAATT